MNSKIIGFALLMLSLFFLPQIIMEIDVLIIMSLGVAFAFFGTIFLFRGEKG